MGSKLSKEIVDHINIVINGEIDKYKKLLKGAKKNSDTQTQYDMARVVYADKIEFLQDLRLKLLTETADEVDEELDHDAIFGGHIIFPEHSLITENTELVPIILNKFEVLCVMEKKRKLKLGDSVSVIVKHDGKIKELFICVKERVIFTFDLHKEFNVTIDEIVRFDPVEYIDLTIS